MTTLREELERLADARYGADLDARNFAIAAANLALEAAAKCCEAERDRILACQSGDESHDVNVRLRIDEFNNLLAEYER